MAWRWDFEWRRPLVEWKAQQLQELYNLKDVDKKR